MSEAYTIGASRLCDLRIADDSLAAVHCVIRSEDDGRFFIRDVAPGGTWVRRASATISINGWTEIFAGDVIHVGTTAIPFGASL